MQSKLDKTEFSRVFNLYADASRMGGAKLTRPAFTESEINNIREIFERNAPNYKEALEEFETVLQEKEQEENKDLTHDPFVKAIHQAYQLYQKRIATPAQSQNSRKALFKELLDSDDENAPNSKEEPLSDSEPNEFSAQDLPQEPILPFDTQQESPELKQQELQEAEAVPAPAKIEEYLAPPKENEENTLSKKHEAAKNLFSQLFKHYGRSETIVESLNYYDGFSAAGNSPTIEIQLNQVQVTYPLPPDLKENEVVAYLTILLDSIYKDVRGKYNPKSKEGQLILALLSAFILLDKPNEFQYKTLITNLIGLFSDPKTSKLPKVEENIIRDLFCLRLKTLSAQEDIVACRDYFKGLAETYLKSRIILEKTQYILAEEKMTPGIFLQKAIGDLQIEYEGYKFFVNNLAAATAFYRATPVIENANIIEQLFEVGIQALWNRCDAGSKKNAPKEIEDFLAFLQKHARLNFLPTTLYKKLIEKVLLERIYFIDIPIALCNSFANVYKLYCALNADKKDQTVFLNRLFQAKKLTDSVNGVNAQLKIEKDEPKEKTQTKYKATLSPLWKGIDANNAIFVKKYITLLAENPENKRDALYKPLIEFSEENASEVQAKLINDLRNDVHQSESVFLKQLITCCDDKTLWAMPEWRKIEESVSPLVAQKDIKGALKQLLTVMLNSPEQEAKRNTSNQPTDWELLKESSAWLFLSFHDPANQNDLDFIETLRKNLLSHKERLGVFPTSFAPQRFYRANQLLICLVNLVNTYQLTCNEKQVEALLKGMTEASKEPLKALLELAPLFYPNASLFQPLLTVICQFVNLESLKTLPANEMNQKIVLKAVDHALSQYVKNLDPPYKKINHQEFQKLIKDADDSLRQQGLVTPTGYLQHYLDTCEKMQCSKLQDLNEFIQFVFENNYPENYLKQAVSKYPTATDYRNAICYFKDAGRINAGKLLLSTLPTIIFSKFYGVSIDNGFYAPILESAEILHTIYEALEKNRWNLLTESSDREKAQKEYKKMSESYLETLQDAFNALTTQVDALVEKAKPIGGDCLDKVNKLSKSVRSNGNAINNPEIRNLDLGSMHFALYSQYKNYLGFLEQIKSYCEEITNALKNLPSEIPGKEEQLKELIITNQAAMKTETNRVSLEYQQLLKKKNAVCEALKAIAPTENTRNYLETIEHIFSELDLAVNDKMPTSESLKRVFEFIQAEIEGRMKSTPLSERLGFLKQVEKEIQQRKNTVEQSLQAVSDLLKKADGEFVTENQKIRTEIENQLTIINIKIEKLPAIIEEKERAKTAIENHIAEDETKKQSCHTAIEKFSNEISESKAALAQNKADLEASLVKGEQLARAVERYFRVPVNSPPLKKGAGERSETGDLSNQNPPALRATPFFKGGISDSQNNLLSHITQEISAVFQERLDAYKEELKDSENALSFQFAKWIVENDYNFFKSWATAYVERVEYTLPDRIEELEDSVRRMNALKDCRASEGWHPGFLANLNKPQDDVRWITDAMQANAVDSVVARLHSSRSNPEDATSLLDCFASFGCSQRQWFVFLEQTSICANRLQQLTATKQFNKLDKNAALKLIQLPHKLDALLQYPSQHEAMQAACKENIQRHTQIISENEQKVTALRGDIEVLTQSLSTQQIQLTEKTDAVTKSQEEFAVLETKQSALLDAYHALFMHTPCPPGYSPVTAVLSDPFLSESHKIGRLKELILNPQNYEARVEGVNVSVDPVYIAVDQGTPETLKLLLTALKDVASRINISTIDDAKNNYEYLINTFGSAQHAIELNDLEKLKLLVEAGYDLNRGVSVSNKWQEPPLLFAYETGKTAIVDYLLELPRINLNLIDTDTNRSLLHKAVERGDHAMIGRLVNKPQVEVDITNKEAETPLYLAIFGEKAPPESRYETIRLLVETGKTVATECVLDVSNPLPFQIVDKDQNTFLHRAILDGDLLFANWILKRKIYKDLLYKQNKYGHTPLQMAARMGNLNAVKAILAAGFDINHMNSDGSSILSTALSGLPKTKAVLDFILENDKLDINKLQKDKGHDALLKAVACRSGHHYLPKLVEKGFSNFCVPNAEGSTLLHFAVQANNLTLVAQLLELDSRIEGRVKKEAGKPNEMKDQFSGVFGSVSNVTSILWEKVTGLIPDEETPKPPFNRKNNTDHMPAEFAASLGMINYLFEQKLLDLSNEDSRSRLITNLVANQRVSDPDKKEIIRFIANRTLKTKRELAPQLFHRREVLSSFPENFEELTPLVQREQVTEALHARNVSWVAGFFDNRDKTNIQINMSLETPLQHQFWSEVESATENEIPELMQLKL